MRWPEFAHQNSKSERKVPAAAPPVTLGAAAKGGRTLRPAFARAHPYEWMVSGFLFLWRFREFTKHLSHLVDGRSGRICG